MRLHFPGILLASALCVLGFSSCNSGNDPSGPVTTPVTSVELSAASDTVITGDTLRLTAAARGAGGAVLLRAISWNSLTPWIATVDTTGLVTAVSPGDASIVAAAEGISDTLRLHVSAPPPPCGNDAGNGDTLITGPSGPTPSTGDNDTVFRGFLVDPLNPLIVYLGTERNGIVRSTDGGATWTRLRRGLRWNDVGYPEIWSLAINPSDPTNLFAATTDSPGPLTGSYPSANAGIYRSENSGQTWTRSNCGLTNAKSSFVLFASGIFSNGHTLVASVQAGAPSFMNPPAAYYTGGLFRSTNDGATWSHAVAPAAADSMEYWQIVTRGPGPKLITFAFRDADLSKNVGFLMSIDAGASWTTFAPSVRTKRYYTWVVSKSADTLLAAERDGFTIDRSVDGGTTWTSLQMNAMDGAVSHVAMSPANSRLVFYASGGNKLLRSDDGLATRAIVLSTPDIIQSIQFAPSAPDTLYAITRGYLVYRSTDAGVTWTLRRNIRADVLNAP